MPLPFIHDIRGAMAELREVAVVGQLGLEAIRNPTDPERLHGVSAPDLQCCLTRSLLLAAHSIFEFALQQATEHCIDGAKRTRRGAGPAVERYARALLSACGVEAEIISPDWQKALAMSKARNLIAHTTGFQDRDFSREELAMLSSLGIRDAVVCEPPYYRAFFFESACIDRVCELYARLLSDLDKTLSLPDGRLAAGE
jgi:hypothetical protein